MKRGLIFTVVLLSLSVFISLPHTVGADSTKWSLPEGAVARLGNGGMYDMVLSPDGKLLAVAGKIGIWLYDAGTGEERALLRGHTGPVESVSFSPDGLTLVSGSLDHTVRLWDVATGREKSVLTGHTGRVLCVSFSPDGLTLASGSLDRKVRLWDVATSTERTALGIPIGYLM